MFSQLLTTLAEDSSARACYRSIINPFSPYYLCDHFVGREVHEFDIPVEAHDLFHTRDVGAIQDFDIVYVQANFLGYFVLNILPIMRARIILFTGQWHLPRVERSTVTDYLLQHPNILLWVSQNPIYPNGEKYRAFPYGIGHYNLVHYAQVLLRPSPPKTVHFALLHLAVNTNPCRARLPVGELLPVDEFYERVAEAQFVLSPIGDRDDCYRHYEAIGLGTIPVSNAGEYYINIFGENMVYYDTETLVLVARAQQVDRAYFEPARDLICLEYHRRALVDAVEQLKHTHQSINDY